MQLLPYQFMSYPQDLRRKIKERFNIKPSGGVVVVDDRVVDEGVTENDLVDVLLEDVRSFVEEITQEPVTEVTEPIVEETQPVVEEAINQPEVELAPEAPVSVETPVENLNNGEEQVEASEPANEGTV